jgi:hypothetical protein
MDLLTFSFFPWLGQISQSFFYMTSAFLFLLLLLTYFSIFSNLPLIIYQFLLPRFLFTFISCRFPDLSILYWFATLIPEPLYLGVAQRFKISHTLSHFSLI